jgi:RNA polymerase-binding transcription factor DksA
MARRVRLREASMSRPSPEPEPDTGLDNVLARRAEELSSLLQSEHDTAFSGDQREMTGELSMVGQHPADVADFTYQRELQQTTQNLLAREVQQVAAAQHARETGKYGVCQECGKRIPPQRLRARPEATLCVSCQRQREGHA